MLLLLLLLLLLMLPLALRWMPADGGCSAAAASVARAIIGNLCCGAAHARARADATAPEIASRPQSQKNFRGETAAHRDRRDLKAVSATCLSTAAEGARTLDHTSWFSQASTASRPAGLVRSASSARLSGCVGAVARVRRLQPAVTRLRRYLT